MDSGLNFFDKGREERRYVVSYWDSRTETEKEKIYSPSLKEIIPIDMDMPIAVAEPVTPSRSAGSSNTSKQTSGHGNVSRVQVYQSNHSSLTHISPSQPFLPYSQITMAPLYGHRQSVW